MSEIIIPKLGKLFDQYAQIYGCSLSDLEHKLRVFITDFYQHQTGEVVIPKVQLDFAFASIKIKTEKGYDITPIDDEDLIRSLSSYIFNGFWQWMKQRDWELHFSEFKQIEKTVIKGRIVDFKGDDVLLALKSSYLRSEVLALLPKSEQVRTENYERGQDLLVYLKEVTKQEDSEPLLIVSRASVYLVVYLLYCYCSELREGNVRIRSVVRETQFSGLRPRTKIAVDAKDRSIDPVRVIVGDGGERINRVREEINGEFIDVVRWYPYFSDYVREALKPGIVEDVVLTDSQSKSLVAYVKDDGESLSAAIGAKGQNVRLASNLTGFFINIQQY